MNRRGQQEKKGLLPKTAWSIMIYQYCLCDGTRSLRKSFAATTSLESS